MTTTEPLVETPEFSAFEIAELCMKANALNRIVTKKKVLRAIHNPRKTVKMLLGNKGVSSLIISQKDLAQDVTTNSLPFNMTKSMGMSLILSASTDAKSPAIIIKSASLPSSIEPLIWSSPEQ